MPREKQDLRENIALLQARYPDHDMLTIEQVMQVMGWKSKTTARKHVAFVNGRVSKVAVARLMCG